MGTIFKGQAVQEVDVSWTVLPLKKVPVGCPETSVRNNHSTLCKIPKTAQITKNGFYCTNFHETHNDQWHYVKNIDTEFHTDRYNFVIHSFSILSNDRSKASSKRIPPHSAI